MVSAHLAAEFKHVLPKCLLLGKKGIINWYQFYLSRRGSDVHSSIFRFHPEEWFTPCHFTPERGSKVIHAAGKGPK